jgi:hypothetical protein
MNPTLLETVQELQQQAERLEREAATLRQALARVAASLTNSATVIAHYCIEGESYAITQGDVEAVRRRLIKPRSEETLRELALVNKMAEQRKHWSREQHAAELERVVEAIRLASIADGTAIEHEAEAAIDD